jgi:hypothetical protein
LGYKRGIPGGLPKQVKIVVGAKHHLLGFISDLTTGITKSEERARNASHFDRNDSWSGRFTYGKPCVQMLNRVKGVPGLATSRPPFDDPVEVGSFRKSP